jgi:predicted nucleic acid-binding protein
MQMRSFEKQAMTERWILNASPLIVLSRVGQEHLFQALAGDIVVPAAVAREVNAGGASDPAVRFLARRSARIVESPRTPEELLAWDLGAGETAVIACALADPSWTVILDDGAARRCARSFDLRVKGTLAVILMAKQAGLVPSAADVLHRLVASGFRLDDAVIREALSRTVGEDWP